jgi:hypothetical protein
MVNEYTIATHITGKKRIVKVRIYERLQDLRGAETRYKNWSGFKDENNDFVGICHSWYSVYINPNGEEYEREWVNLIRLCREHLTPTIIAHEFAHAAQWIYSLDFPDDKEPMRSDNEEFAYLYGELLGAFWPMVHDAVIFDKPKSKEEL